MKISEEVLNRIDQKIHDLGNALQPLMLGSKEIRESAQYMIDCNKEFLDDLIKEKLDALTSGYDTDGFLKDKDGE